MIYVDAMTSMFLCCYFLSAFYRIVSFCFIFYGDHWYKCGCRIIGPCRLFLTFIFVIACFWL